MRDENLGEQNSRNQRPYEIDELFYSNALGVDVGPNEFILTFSQESPDRLIDYQSVAMSPSNALSLYRGLEQMMKFFEDNYYDIPDPEDYRAKKELDGKED